MQTMSGLRISPIPIDEPAVNLRFPPPWAASIPVVHTGGPDCFCEPEMVVVAEGVAWVCRETH